MKAHPLCHGLSFYPLLPLLVSYKKVRNYEKVSIDRVCIIMNHTYEQARCFDVFTHVATYLHCQRKNARLYA